MALLTGYFVPSNTYGAEAIPPNLDSVFDGYGTGYWYDPPFELVEPSLIQRGFLSGGRRKSPYNARKQHGYVVPAYADDMYNRIWFLSYNTVPIFVDFGVILRPTTRKFVIWNAYIHVDIVCTSIVYSDDEQFEIFGPNGEEPPWTLARLGLREYEATAFTLGLWQFRVTVTWGFSNQDIFPTTVDGVFVGLRATLYPLAPLYNTMQEKLESLTDVIETINGVEQRIKVRQQPRQFYKFKGFIRTEEELAFIEALHFQWSKRAWGVPVWGEAVLYDDQIILWETVVTFDTSNASFKIGSAVVFWRSPDYYSLNVIEDINDITGEVTFDLEIDKAFNGNVWIIPVISMWMDGPVKIRVTPDGQSEATASFAGVVAEELTESYTPISTLMESEDVEAALLPIIQVPSVVRKVQKLMLDGDTKVVDRKTGIFGIYSDSLYPNVIYNIRFRKENREDVWEFRQLLHYLCGKLKPMWIPTHRQDLTFAYPDGHNATDSTLYFNETRITGQYGHTPNRTALHFQMSDGSYHDHFITDLVETVDELVRITIADALGVPSANDNCTVSWLDKCRLVSDDVTIKWEAIDILESEVKVLRIED